MSSTSYRDLLGNAEGFKTIPESTYEAVVDRCEARTSAKGKTMFATMFKIDGGPNDGHPIWTNLTISPESPTALGIFFRQMAALGLDGAFFEAEPTDEQVAHAITGKRATITVKITEYPAGSGSMKNEVSGIKPSSTSAANPLAVAPAPAAPSPGEAPAAPF